MADRKTLLNVLQKIGKAPEEIHFSDGSRVLLLPYGGRILGLYPPESEDNFFWTHPQLNTAETGLAFYEKDAWHNSGGDRTWLSPEAQLFIADLQHPWETYQVPLALDPGKYAIEKENDVLHIANQLTVEQHESGQSADVQISKFISPAPNPLRHDPSLDDDVSYAGYTLHTSLKILSDAKNNNISVGLWGLLQLPHGGEMLLSTYSPAEPVVQFGQVDPKDITVNTRLLQYRMTAEGIQKIGVCAPCITGRAAYLYPLSPHEHALVVRNFHVNPSEQYIDVPWDNLNTNGYCFQACNVSDNDFGKFSELEHHTPAIGLGTDKQTCTDISQVWAFRGSKQTIKNIACRLLGANDGFETV